MGRSREERMQATVRFLCEEVHPRDYLHTANLDRAARWISSSMGEMGFPVEVQEYQLPEGTYRNVAARIQGKDPDAGVVVVGAHYDAVPGTPGADDNASGMAVLLEAARGLRDGDRRRTLYLVAFSTEEPPFFGSDSMGSHFFASGLASSGEEVHLMIALDLVGYFSDQPGTQRYPLADRAAEYPVAGNFLVVTSDLDAGDAVESVAANMDRGSDLPVYPAAAPESSGFVHLSDHLSFRRFGMPGVLVTDTAMLRNPNYHKMTDTPETLDFARMGAAVDALRAALDAADAKD